MGDYVPGLSDLPPVFDRYRILRQLGRGGMGAVYLADDTRLDRQVAIKIPSPHGLGDSALLQRFQQEAIVLARLHHPNLCAVYDASTHDGIPYMTMRYIEGKPLRQKLAAYRGREGVVLIETIANALVVAYVGHCGPPCRGVKVALFGVWLGLRCRLFGEPAEKLCGR